ncbi:hypothetical protein, partial [Pseudomonas laurylsulfatiphila]|uniref:hypothetical protein n=1 Tax=Pseudomonas laurylsulfatiphila TaxID=2011015 RepID=UPI003D1A20AA
RWSSSYAWRSGRRSIRRCLSPFDVNHITATRLAGDGALKDAIAGKPAPTQSSSHTHKKTPTLLLAVGV